MALKNGRGDDLWLLGYILMHRAVGSLDNSPCSAVEGMTCGRGIEG